ncbi:hypothetical protein MKW98_020185 [Papaver atlanticum]|uniref:K Homology domain-containing protein n=1 Tax=Papaver atlanticum TaxID=357466 RepID=A0AAD4SBY8_9MAGN|nr:hypothetical protein MKW98_020185 [Papaver atlanticum]
MLGVPLDIICQCLGPALKGRHHILNHMEQEINAPRSSHLDDWDRVDSDLVVFKLTADSLQRLVGPDGAQKREFERETGGRIVCIVGDRVTIAVKNETGLREVRKKMSRPVTNYGVVKGAGLPSLGCGISRPAASSQVHSSGRSGFFNTVSLRAMEQ